MRKLVNLYFLLLIGLNFNFAFASQSRVMEVQAKIKNDITQFLEKFAPGTKHSVQVKIKPLKRKIENNRGSDYLPFMEYQDELNIDEWDDASLNIYSLYSRISEAQITVYLEDKVKIQDTQRFKEALLNEVNLVAGRDTVVIENIATPVLEKVFNWKDQTEILLLGVMLIIAVILGVGLNSLSNKISPQQVVTKSEAKESSSQIGSGPVASVMPLAQAVATNQAPSGELKGDLSIQDPTKINELVGKKIQKLLAAEVFPTLSDMVILEELLKSDPSSFSYLIYEFPQEVQKNLYQLGRGEQWFKGFSEVGFPSKVVLMTLDRMLRNRTINVNAKFEDLLMHVWRISNNLEGFIKNLTKDHAFAILYYLPKYMAIPIGRNLYPGSWGAILESRNTFKIDKADEIQKLIVETLKFEPYFNYESLQVFKNRKDLLRYLDTVEPHEEKDIYAVLGKESDLFSVRPPFYKFFELNKEQRLSIFRKYSINEWAIIAFNIERHEKDLITDLMDEKERYLFGHALRAIDQNPVLASSKHQLREVVARLISHSSISKNENISINEEGFNSNVA
jgi:hypothetical protein